MKRASVKQKRHLIKAVFFVPFPPHLTAFTTLLQINMPFYTCRSPFPITWWVGPARVPAVGCPPHFAQGMYLPNKDSLCCAWFFLCSQTHATSLHLCLKSHSAEASFCVFSPLEKQGSLEGWKWCFQHFISLFYGTAVCQLKQCTTTLRICPGSPVGPSPCS